jgi:hypothetical protein
MCASCDDLLVGGGLQGLTVKSAGVASLSNLIKVEFDPKSHANSKLITVLD